MSWGRVCVFVLLVGACNETRIDTSSIAAELVYDCAAQSEIPQSECDALVALYNSTDGDNWTDNSGWGTGNPSSWFGITVSGGAVTNIDLETNGLAGTLPDLSALLSLQSLDVWSNSLTGGLPASLGGLSSLESMNLCCNDFSGGLPPEWSGLTSLTSMNLQFNSVSGNIPSAWSGMSSIQTLALGSNDLSGEVAPVLNQLTTLTNLALWGNQFSGSLPDLSGLTNLVEFNFGSNLLTGPVPAYVADLTTLEVLHLDNNKLSGPLPTAMNENLVNLTDLKLENNGCFSDGGDAGLRTWLDMNNPSWEGSCLAYDCGASQNEIPVGQCQALIDFYNAAFGPGWNNNSGWGTGDPSTWYGVTVAGGVVTELDFEGNGLVGPVSDLSQLTSLTSLNLRNNQLSGPLPLSIDSLTTLIQLDLAFNQFSGTLPPSYAQLTNLRELNLVLNDLGGEIPAMWGALTSLVELRLGANNLTGAIPATINNITSLEHLTLYSNDLSGPLPDLSGLVALRSFNAGSNAFTGEVPAWVATLTSLETLHLDENQLSGALPVAMDDNLVILNSLKLEGNNCLTDGGDAVLHAWLDTNNTGWDDGCLVYDCAAQGEIPETECVALLDLYNENAGANWTDNTGWGTGMPSTWASVGVAGGHVDTLIFPQEGGVSGALPNSFGNLVELTRLELGYNQVTSLPSTISALTKLRNLVLGNNQLTGPIPAALGDLTELRELVLSGNDLSGSIPASLGNLVNLNRLWLARNQLSGAIPAEIGNMAALDDFRAERNSLSGPLPAELAQLSNLETLWLNHNQISGTVPAGLDEGLVNLTSLLLNGNDCLNPGLDPALEAWLDGFDIVWDDGCTSDSDGDGTIDADDNDDDNDGVLDVYDPAPLDPDVCGDVEGDGCDDCSVGSDDLGPGADADPSNDGTDSDGDGMCDAGDTDPEKPSVHCSGNLFANAGFAKGAVDFATDYTENNATSLIAQEYSITDDPLNAHPLFESFSDHSTGSSQMMIVDGAMTSDIDFFSTTANVTATETYTISFWTRYAVFENPSQLRLVVDNVPVMTFAPVTGSWRNDRVQWTAPATGAVEIALQVTTLSGSGNDFAIDDIYIGNCDDADFDGVADGDDNCPNDVNTNQSDADGDGIGDVCDASSDDADDDGLTDDEEVALGTNPADADSDDDGVLDGDEAVGDADGDGLVNALDPDSDNDGLFDGTELGLTNSDLGADTFVGAGHFVPDADGGSETTDPLNSDSDGGGAIDGAEDVNGNGALDAGETNPTVASDDGELLDSDGDGLSDALELRIGIDPNDADSDDDGIVDSREPNFISDSDADGFINALDADSDDDGLLDGTEFGLTADDIDAYTDLGAGAFVGDADPTTTTSVLLGDSDGGGVPDGVEDCDRNGRHDDVTSCIWDLGAAELDPLTADDDVIGLAALHDFDNDSIPDVVDGVGDHDGDGIENYKDTDSDGDGISDAEEAGDAVLATPPRDSDGSGLADYRDIDADNDHLGDALEGTVDSDGDGIADYIDSDADGDGVPDVYESLGNEATIPADSDGDGTADYLDLDSDDDTISDSDEARTKGRKPGDFDDDGVANYRDADSDGDGVADADEAGDADLSTPPRNSDGAGLPDFLDTDSDNDGAGDGDDNCLVVANPGQEDADADGIGSACDEDEGGGGGGCDSTSQQWWIFIFVALWFIRLHRPEQRRETAK